MNREYTWPGYVAIGLAVLFPVYWLIALWQGLAASSFMDSVHLEFEHLGLLDGLFVLIGLMEIYLYLSLYRVLKQTLGGGLSAALALALAIAVFMLTATVVVDVILAVGPGLPEGIREGLISSGVVWFLVSAVFVGLIGLALAIVLLVGGAGDATLLKLFAIALLFSSILALTIFLAPLSCLGYAVAFLLLGVFFLRGGFDVEVV